MKTLQVSDKGRELRSLELLQWARRIPAKYDATVDGAPAIVEEA